MVVSVTGKTRVEVDMDNHEAFHVLCKTLCMDFVLDEDYKYCVKANEYGELAVFQKDFSGKWNLIDDRGLLFIALRNVAVNMFPNLKFRSDSYILVEEDFKEAQE